jgi:hypothetical protein
MKRLLTVLALALVTALAPSSATASIGPTDITICNLSSNWWIWPHELPTGWGNYGTELRPGQCGTYHNNNGQLRVYIPEESYQYGTWGLGYGPCKNAPWDSDPPNDKNGTTQAYRAFAHDNCVN